MKKHLTVPFLLAVTFAASAPPPARAMCVNPGPPHLLEAEVVACESPRTAAEERMRNAKRAMAGPGVEEMMAGRPGQLLTLKVIRSQQLSDDPRAQEGITLGAWTPAEKTEEKKYLLLDAKGCEGFEPGARQVLLEEFVCCDVLPHQDLSCLLQLPVVVVPPESLRGGAKP